MAYVSTVLGDSPVGFWELGEPSGTTATDAAGNSNGTYSGSGITLGQAGIPGAGGVTAARFTAASSGNISIPVVVANQITDVFTFEIWVKRASSGAQNIMCGEYTGAPQMYFDGSGHIICDNAGASNIMTSTVAVTDTTTFHHIVWTKNGATNKLFLDGVDVTPSVTNATCGLALASYSIGVHNSIGYLDATAQFPAIYLAAISSGAVASHYSVGGPPPPTAVSNTAVLRLESQQRIAAVQPT